MLTIFMLTNYFTKLTNSKFSLFQIAEEDYDLNLSNGTRPHCGWLHQYLDTGLVK